MFDVTCLDSFGNVVNALTQWDINQTLYIEDSGFETAPIFHFCNQNTEKALCVQSEFHSGHILEVKVPNQLLVEPYPVIAYVYMGSGNSFKTVEYLRFPLRARPQPHDFLFAENVEVVWLQDLIQEVKELNESVTEAESGRAHNESIRITNEDTRIQAEKERAAAEALRKKAEAERDTAERQRAENEKSRESSEASRSQKETERQAKESGRQAAETVREANEDTRVANEEERAANEDTRKKAEGIRQANETTRQSNEDIRQQKEDGRQAAEAERTADENARKDAEDARETAEASRADAESARDGNENERIADENARQAAEAKRNNAEDARVIAETARADAEAIRDGNENERIADENARQAAESTRDDEENVREANEQQRIANENARKNAETERGTEFSSMSEAISSKITEANKIIEDNGNAKSHADAAAASAQEAKGHADASSESAAESEYWSKQAQAVVNIGIAEVGKPGIVSPDGKTITITEDGVITGASSGFTGTKAEYEEAVAAGQIADGTIVNITDDYREGGGSTEIDNELSETSENPVQNKVVAAKFNQVNDLIIKMYNAMIDLENRLLEFERMKDHILLDAEYLTEEEYNVKITVNESLCFSLDSLLNNEINPLFESLRNSTTIIGQDKYNVKNSRFYAIGSTIYEVFSNLEEETMSLNTLGQANQEFTEEDGGEEVVKEQFYIDKNSVVLVFNSIAGEYRIKGKLGMDGMEELISSLFYDFSNVNDDEIVIYDRNFNIILSEKDGEQEISSVPVTMIGVGDKSGNHPLCTIRNWNTNTTTTGSFNQDYRQVGNDLLATNDSLANINQYLSDDYYELEQINKTLPLYPIEIVQRIPYLPAKWIFPGDHMPFTFAFAKEENDNNLTFVHTPVYITYLALEIMEKYNNEQNK